MKNIMNTKIKELIAQCTFTVTEYQLGIDSSYEDFDKEMFAELIVKECAKVVDNKLDFTFASGPDDWASGDDLLDHFGVKK